MLLFCAATAAEWRAACPEYGGSLPEHSLLPWRAPNGQEHALCITGVGPANAALALGLCLGVAQGQGTRFEAVVNLGVAGSFDLTRAPLGSAWRVQREIWPEYGLHCASDTDVGADAKALGFPQWRPAQGESTAHGKEIWQEIDLNNKITALPKMTVQAWPLAVSLTVAGVTNSLDRAARLCAKYGALLENMEGFALALGCARQAVPLLEVRTVSNMVGSRAPEHRDFPRALDALRPALHKLLESAHA